MMCILVKGTNLHTYISLGINERNSLDTSEMNALDTREINMLNTNKVNAPSLLWVHSCTSC